MNAQSIHRAGELSLGTEMASAWTVALLSLALWSAFTPYVAHDQARQLVQCFGSMALLFLTSKTETVKKKISQVRDLHGNHAHGSAA